MFALRREFTSQSTRPYANVTPVCGLDRCARCGACLGCEADTACEGEPRREHVWVLTQRRQELLLARDLLHEALAADYARWVAHMLASGARVERATGEAA